MSNEIEVGSIKKRKNDDDTEGEPKTKKTKYLMVTHACRRYKHNVLSQNVFLCQQGTIPKNIERDKSNETKVGSNKKRKSDDDVEGEPKTKKKKKTKSLMVTHVCTRHKHNVHIHKNVLLCQ